MFNDPDAQVQSSILLIGDSFRPAMVPSLREKFSDVFVVHRNYDTSGLLDKIDPEYLLVEYAERYSSGIKNIDALVE